MNTPNPLIPGGAFSQIHQKSRVNARLAVFTILAVHVILLVGLLAQGCGPKKTEQTTTGATNESILPPLATNDLYFAPSNPPIVPSAPVTDLPAPNAAIEAFPVVPEPIVPTKEYTVIRNDNYSKIAKAHGVTVRALSQANPTVDPAKLQVGQKLLIPVSTQTSSAPASIRETVTAAKNGASLNGSSNGRMGSYVVKSGDTLARIARNHGVTVKSIRSANNLKTDQIKVGQKLKVGAKPFSGETNRSPATSQP